MQNVNLAIEQWPVDRVVPYGKNPRIIPDTAIAMVASSIEQFGWRQPIVVDEAGVILVGHTRRLAALKLGHPTVPVHVARGLTARQAKAYRLADNRVGEETGWDIPALDLELAELDGPDLDLGALGFDLPAAELAGPGESESAGASLLDRFGIAPFSVLNARDGWWQDRKRAWLALGIKSEVGRGGNALGFSETVLAATGRKGGAHG